MDYHNPVNNSKLEGFFRKLKNLCPIDEEIEGTEEIIKIFNLKKGEVTKICLKGDAILLTCVLEKLLINYKSIS